MKKEYIKPACEIVILEENSSVCIGTSDATRTITVSDTSATNGGWGRAKGSDFWDEDEDWD